MAEMRASIVMNLTGNVERRARRYGQALGTMSRMGRRHLGVLGRSTQMLGRGLDRLGNRYTALITGAAGVAQLRALTQLETRFTRLGIQANRTDEEMDALRRQIFETARAAEIRVDPGEITSAVEAIVEKTGDLEFAQENLRNIGLAISATGAAGANIGDILAEFQKMDIRVPEEVLRSLDTLNEQGKAGAFTLQNLAALGPRVVTAYTALGREGPQAIREMGAALQVIRQGTGTSEQAATAFEALLRTLQQADKVKVLERGGITIFDPDELERGRQVLRPINEIMVDIIQAADGRATVLSQVFDAEALRAFNAALGEYNRTGGVESLQRFLDVQGDGAATTRDSARAADTAAQAMQNLSTAWQQFADANLTNHIQSAADALNSLDPETVDRWLKIGGILAGGLGAAYAARSVGRLVGDLSSMGRRAAGRGALGGVAGAASAMRPIPVFVVNWGGGMGGGAGGRGRAPGGRTGNVRRPGTWRTLRAAPNLRTIGAMGAGAVGTAGLGVGAAGAAGYGAGTLLNSTLIEGTETGQRIGHSIGRGIAGVLAAFGHEASRDAIRAERQAEEMGTLNIRVDQDGRVRSVTPERGRDGPDLDVDVGMPEVMF
ncbi:MAG: phage tail tape measure protein [Aquisalimonadaceae bacterium]